LKVRGRREHGGGDGKKKVKGRDKGEEGEAKGLSKGGEREMG
jgi:hypothetical protein